MAKHKFITNISIFLKELDKFQKYDNGNVMKKSIDLHQVENLIIEIENKLDLISYKKQRKGMIFKLNPHFQLRPMKEYKINSTCTTVKIIKINEGWRLFDLKREIIYSQKVQFLNPENFESIFSDFFKTNSFI